MNYFELYPGDYLRDTTRLTLIEHGAYLRLLMAYYAEEVPLPADHNELFVISGAISHADKAAVRKVAERFFPVGEDGVRRNGRADEEIAKAQGRIQSSEGRKGTESERQRRTRARRTQMFADLREVGIVPDAMISMADLRALHEANVTRDSGVTDRDMSRVVTGVNTATTRHTPHAIHHQELLAPTHTNVAQASPPSMTDAGRACRLMRDAGCAQVNPSNPNLLDALEEGVTPETLGQYAGLAVANGKTSPFAYAIAAARGDHRQPKPGATHAAGTPGRKLSAVERVEANIQRARRARGELDDDALEGQATRVPR